MLLHPRLTSSTAPVENISVAGNSKINFRMIFIVSILALTAFLAIGVILIGYAAATQHAIGKFAPLGNPVNVKTK
jgi:hypothetical protein